MKLCRITVLLYSLSVVSAVQMCRKDIYETKLQTPTEDIEVMAIWLPVRAGTLISSHLCSSQTGQPIWRYCSYNRDANTASWNILDEGTEFLNCSLIGGKCLAQPFEHEYLMKNKVTKQHTNRWPATKLGVVAKPADICLLESGLPLTRKCLYSPKHRSVEWEEKDFKHAKCLRDLNQAIVTYDLEKLYEETKAIDLINGRQCLRVAANLTTLLEKAGTVRIASDLEIATNILQPITSIDTEPAMLPKVLHVTNLLMKCNDSIVLSSKAMGTPKLLIRTLETYLDRMTNIMMPTSRCDAVTEGVYCKSENLTTVFYINPACSNISGIAVYNASVPPSPSMIYDRPSDTYIRYLRLNQTVDELMNEPHVEAAAYFPEALWNRLFNVEAVRISLYKNKNFFVDEEHFGRMPNGIVLKIAIPGYNGDLPDDLLLIFRNHDTDSQAHSQCGRYAHDRWISNAEANSNDRNLVLCNTRQTTPFIALIGLNNDHRLIVNSPMLTVIMEFILDFISIAGCALSLLGLTCIWLTALCFKQWRTDPLNIVLLNVCFVLTLIMLYFLFINIPALRNAVINMMYDHQCIAEGVFLHYTVLVLFLWMFFIAIELYHQYVTVYAMERTTHFIAKYALAAWTLPLVPITLVIYLDVKSYMPYTESDTICYPSGRGLYLAVLLPICIVIVANAGIFIYILCSLRMLLKHFEHIQPRKKITAQVRLSIMLFFCLGISWIFGILAHMTHQMVFSLLFCLTSTLQGFILFIYFVIFDQGTRVSWLKYLCGRNYYSLDNSNSFTLSAKGHH